MNDLGLNKYLQPLNTPIASNKSEVNSYSFDSENERNTITLSKIKNFSFSSGTGGTITLGGTVNGNGVVDVVNENGTSLISIDANGINYFGSATFSDYFVNGTSVGNIGLDMDTLGGLGINAIGTPPLGFPIKLQSTTSISAIANLSVLLRAGTLDESEISMSGTSIDLYTDNFNINGTLNVNGTVKTAIVPTSQGYNALYTIESPNVWFMDKGTVVHPPFWKFWEKPRLNVDPLFLETIEEIDHTIQTSKTNVLQVWGIRKGFNGTRLENKTRQEFENNTIFWGGAHSNNYE